VRGESGNRAARARVLALGKALDVHGTPTLFINGRRINNVLGMPYELLKDVVNWSEKDAK